MTNTHYPHTYLYGWTAIVTLTTFIAGILAILKGAGLLGDIFLLPDIPGGLILILLATIFAAATIKGREDRPGWISFSYIASLLLLVFAGCSILIEGGTYLTQLMEGEETNILTIISSAFIWAGIIAFPLYIGVSKLLYTCSCGGDSCE